MITLPFDIANPDALDAETFNALTLFKNLLNQSSYSLVDASSALQSVCDSALKNKIDLNAIEFEYRFAGLNHSDEGKRLPLIFALLIRSGDSQDWQEEEDTHLSSDHLPTESVEAFAEGLIRILIQHGYNINASCQAFDQCSPLIIAASFSQRSITQLLLEHGAYVNAKSDSKTTALMLASLHGDPEFAALLIDHGADVNKKDINGKTALAGALASAKQHLGASAVFALLLEHGAKPNAQTFNGETFWHQLARQIGQGYSAALLPLLNESDCNALLVTKDQQTPIHTLISTLSAAVFLSSSNPISIPSCLSFMAAVHAKGVSLDAINVHGDAAIHLAVRLESIEVLQWLVEHGANLHLKDQNGKRAKSLAAARGNLKTVAYLEAVGLAREETRQLTTLLSLSGDSKLPESSEGISRTALIEKIKIKSRKSL